MTAPSARAAATRAAALLPAVLVLAATLPPLRGLWHTQGAPMEEGFMLVFPELVMDGQLPNRDFLHLYGPGSLWVLAAAYSLFGVHLDVERVVGYLQILGVGFGVYRLLRPWGRWVAAGGAAIGLVVLLPASGLTAMAWVGGVALGLWSVALGADATDEQAPSRVRHRRALAAGILAGAALLYRLDLVLAIGLAGWALWRGLDPGARRRLVIGLAGGVSPYLVHLGLAGPASVIEGLVLEPVLDLRGGRHLPIPPSGDRYDGFLQGAGALDPPSWPLPHLSGPRQLWVWFFFLLVSGILLVVAGLLAHRRRGDRRLLVIAAFSVGMFPQALQRPDSTHLAWVGCVAFAVLPVALIELNRTTRRAAADPGPRTAPRAGAAAVLVTGLVLLIASSDFTFRTYADMTAKSFGLRPLEDVIEHRGRRFPYKRDDAVAAVRELLPIVEARTEPGDRLIVGPGDLRKTPYSEAFLYHLLPDLVPGTRYIEMDPGVANASDSGLADELRAADVVILSTIRDDWNEPNDSLLFGSPEPNEVLQRDFCLEGEFGIDPFDPDRGLYELYLRC
jgi:hypothetical protein